MPVREGFDVLPEKRKHAHDRAIAQQRHSEVGAYFPDGGGLRQSVFLISCDVSYVYETVDVWDGMIAHSRLNYQRNFSPAGASSCPLAGTRRGHVCILRYANRAHHAACRIRDVSFRAARSAAAPTDPCLQMAQTCRLSRCGNRVRCRGSC
jgi:hypothetical protein